MNVVNATVTTLKNKLSLVFSASVAEPSFFLLLKPEPPFLHLNFLQPEIKLLKLNDNGASLICHVAEPKLFLAPTLFLILAPAPAPAMYCHLKLYRYYNST